MSSGIHLDFDAKAWSAKREQYERTLLGRVRDHDSDPATALEAATELLRWFARFQNMESPEVQAVIEEGVEAVMRKVACAALDLKAGARTEVTPLDFFPLPRKVTKSGGPKKTGVKQRMLELRAAHGDYLTADDMLLALTTSGGRTVPREKWPRTVGEVERTLIDYLASPYSDVPIEKRSAFVRESFPDIDWDNSKEVVEYSSPLSSSTAG